MNLKKQDLSRWTQMKSEADVRSVLEKHVEDPELGIDIITLELVYGVDVISDKEVAIKMTFTSPLCPFGPQLVGDVEQALKTYLGFETVTVDVVFDPPWVPSEELKAALGIGSGH